MHRRQIIGCFVVGTLAYFAAGCASNTSLDDAGAEAGTGTDCLRTPLPCSDGCPNGQARVGGICVGTGPLRISLTWDHPGDLDLAVRTPGGTVLSFRNPTGDGGTLDHDDTMGTGPENVFWMSTPPSGTYDVCVGAFLGTNAGATATITVAEDGHAPLVRHFLVTTEALDLTNTPLCSRTVGSYAFSFDPASLCPAAPACVPVDAGGSGDAGSDAGAADTGGSSSDMGLDAGSASDVGTDVGSTDMGSTDASCSAGYAQCGSACVDVSSDVANCGACAHACSGATSVCSNGVCAATCAAGLTNCAGSCVDPNVAHAHCGACPSSCPSGEVCQGGACAASCAAGFSSCAGGCHNLMTDPTSCGSCGHACTGDQTCSGGTCACHFPTSTSCSGVCVDATSDTNNCGACGNACSGATPVCSNGVCVATCNTASMQTACGSQCVVLGMDPMNCGSCSNVCSPTQVCSNGMCQAPPTDPIGCADGTREHFVDTTMFPNIAACRGGWDQPGVFPSPVRVGGAMCLHSGNSGANPNGTTCASSDLCSAGWHLCRGGEIHPRTMGMGCPADTWPADSFYAAGEGSSGCYDCALTTGTIPTGCTNSNCMVGCQENPGLTNDIFGCGNNTFGVDPTTCDVDHSGNDLCNALTPLGGWSCGNDGYRESVNAVFDPSATTSTSTEGGVLCCRDM
jgi:hypothetical protein